VVFGTKPIGMIDEEWVVLERKVRILINVCFVDSVLLNVFEEKTTTYLWKNLGYLYWAKSLVNKIFPWKKLFSLRMGDGDSVVEHLNAFNTIVTRLGCLRFFSLIIYVKRPFRPHCNQLLMNEHSRHISFFGDRLPPF
jgi:hypothetical protein